jgi:hypothetical protein
MSVAATGRLHCIFGPQTQDSSGDRLVAFLSAPRKSRKNQKKAARPGGFFSVDFPRRH